MTNVTAQYKAEIQARVFRVRSKPTWFPRSIWNILSKYNTRLTHRTENLGTVASTKEGNITITR